MFRSVTWLLALAMLSGARVVRASADAVPVQGLLGSTSVAPAATLPEDPYRQPMRSVVSVPWGIRTGTPARLRDSFVPTYDPQASGRSTSAIPADPSPRSGPGRVALRPSQVEHAKRDPLSMLTEKDKTIMAEAAEGLARKALPWLDFRILQKLEFLRMLRFANAEFKWNVIQKPGRSMLSAGSGGSPALLQGRISVHLIQDRWNVACGIDHPLDGPPHLELKVQVWSKSRFHVDLGHGFAVNERFSGVLRSGGFATAGMKLGILGLDYSYRGREQAHQVLLGTLF